MGKNEFDVRVATAADIPALGELIEQSVRVLQAADYTQAQMDGALGTLLGVDSQLIADGTYFVVEASADDGVAQIVACGGWSKRRTLFGADRRADREDDLLDPAKEAAKIRAFFVRPGWERRGIGTLLLSMCENAAADAGFSRFELGSTLTGVALYRERGYEELERIHAPLPNCETLEIVKMRKSARQAKFEIRSKFLRG
ncbi:MAG TPA: GNAT family N-acetyltransferase [Candidatus Acidoferrales bacterium]|nr:GNAT family N-acetyltransferase [Candidatus Acidoferrales bacterium]